MKCMFVPPLDMNSTPKMGGNSEETKESYGEQGKSIGILEMFWGLWRWFGWEKRTPQNTSTESQQITKNELKPLEPPPKPVSRPKSAPIDIPKRVQPRPNPYTHLFDMGHPRQLPSK